MIAFLLPPGGRQLSSCRNSRLQSPSPRRPKLSTQMSLRRKEPKRVDWLRMAVIAAGGVSGSLIGAVNLSQKSFDPAPPTIAATPSILSAKPLKKIPLEALGIKQEDFVGERELRRRKTTKLSEAEEEIIDLEEWELETQWYRTMQFVWAATASIGGMYVLYRGGVMWENWIREQEKKDMEEEIELTGTFIDPRAVRKPEDEDEDEKGKGSEKKPAGDSPSGSGPENSEGGDTTSGGIDSLEKLFGQS